MSNTIWKHLLNELDQQVITAAGYDVRGASTFNSRRDGKSPALLIIDMQRLFVGADQPILHAIAQAPSMIGAAGWRAIDYMLPLIDTCRRQKIPIVYARMIPQNRQIDDPLLAIVPPLKPDKDDLIIEKTTTSVFFNTGLAEYLRERRCDSVILAGNSTSGCIRAAAVDATQHQFGVSVPYECVFDRIEASHKISLLDMWMKYANVLSTQALIDRLASLPTQPEQYAEGI